MKWHCLTIEEVIKQNDSSENGLSSELVAQKRLQFGKNELVEKKKKPAWLLFLGQFTDFMILVLLAAAVIAGIAGDLTDTIIIIVIVILNAIVGFIQEYKAEKAMEALKKIAALQAKVIRDGNEKIIDASEIVPGDIVLLEAGNVVPADMRLMECFSLLVEEAALTGESVPVEKNIHALSDEESSIGDRINMVYKSTLITNGRGKGIVTGTGMQTEIGLIAKMLQQEESVTPLQKRMSDFGRKLSYVILLICGLLFGIGLLRGEQPVNMLLISISLAVAAIPEALPALITIALARGAKRLVKQNALVRKLPAVETLGSVTFICSDKTGTLTQNKMKVTMAEAADTGLLIHQHVPLFDGLMALNHDVKPLNGEGWQGDPTEIAIVDYFSKNYTKEWLFHLQEHFPRVAELPFDSDRKCMTTVHRNENKYLVISKGATESITEKLIDDKDLNAIIKNAESWSAEGIRVIAYGYKWLTKLPEPFSFENVENELFFGGLAGMIDPPREEAKQAIAECKTAGIRTVMITGDHPATAAAIARQIGILSGKELVMTGREMKETAINEFEEEVEQIRVYARVSPEQKLTIIKALQAKGHFVSMTGDGVNDAPSLKSANIGVAMGINGTDVSKEAAHMILLDDNFATIVKAVKEGRRIYDNIRKFVKYIMTCNGAEIWTLFLAPLIGLPIPLLPIHILWINLVTDGLPGLALAGEKAEKDIMHRPPRNTNESLFAQGIAYHILWVGLLMAGITLGTQAWAIHTATSHWQTMVFTVLSLSQLGHVLAIRSDREFLYKQGLFSNPMLIGAIFLTFILQLGVIYLPVANAIFKTQPLSLNELIICVLVSAIVFHAVELEKWVKSKIVKRK
jgi:P-type Ca2+ transporter type 2C